MSKTVVIVATLDTKSEEVRYLKDRIEAGGVETLVVDAGALGQPSFPPEITNQQVAELSGSTLQEVRAFKDEGRAMEVMTRGATRAVRELYQQGKLDGIIGLGGSMGTSLGAHIMRSLPFGVPKLMVSTMASRDISPWVGHKDIVMFPSVTDLSGLNRMTRRTLANAAGAIVGMIQADIDPHEARRPLIGIGILGATEGCAKHARPLLEKMGYEVIVFHTVGSGGKALEEAVQQGLTSAVLEISIQELIGHTLGSPYDAGPDRFENAGRIGIPQIVLPGNADFIAWSPPSALPARYENRHLHMHNPAICLVRTNAEEMKMIAEALAEKLNRGRGPAAVVIPTGGFSEYSREGMFFHEPETDKVFWEMLHEALDPKTKVTQVDSNINDAPCAEAMVEALLSLQA